MYIPLSLQFLSIIFLVRQFDGTRYHTHKAQRLRQTSIIVLEPVNSNPRIANTYLVNKEEPLYLPGLYHGIES